VYDFFIFFGLALYLDNILANEYGVSKPFYFFLDPSYWFPEKFTTNRKQQVTTNLKN